MTLSIHSRSRLLQRFRPFRIIDGLLALFVALSLSLGVSGCSAVRLGYNHAPELSYWWLDSFLDFNETQTLKVRADLALLQDWHRAHELPLYVSTLEKMQRMAPSKLSPEQVCELFDELKPRLHALIDQAAPTVAVLAPTLTAEQLDHLARQLNKRGEKWREEWLEGTPTERSARRVKQLLEPAEMLYGQLEEPQLAVLRAAVAASAFDAATSYRESLRRHQDALQTLQRLQPGTLSEGSALAEVRALLGRAMDSPDASYRHYSEKITQENCRAFATLHNSATPTQQLKLIETLSGYVSDARALMAPRP